MKKLLFVFAAALLLIGVVGCACNNGTTNTTTPSPTMTQAVSTPMLSTEPDMSPDAMTSPDANNSEDMMIPNFAAGTEVKPEDIPEIKKAIEDKYQNATISKIVHAEQDGRKVYEVTLTTAGKTETIYVLPDGTMLPETTGKTNGSAS